MTGFRCNVEGGAANASIKKPQPPTYCPSGTGCVSGAKQPMYWANDDSNIAFTGDYEKKPSYNSVWGFENGAQNDIVSGGSKANPAAPAVTEAPSNAEDTTTTATLKTTRQRTTMVTKTRTGVAYAQPTAVKGCKWNGHCAGDSCVGFLSPRVYRDGVGS